MLPVPTRPASETASAWNEDTPELDDLLLNISRSISGTPQTCMKRVRIEKYRPRPRQSPTSAMLQMMSLSELGMHPRLVILLLAPEESPPRRSCPMAANDRKSVV